MSDLDTLKLFHVVTSDPAHQKRLSELHDQMQKILDASEEQRALAEATNASLSAAENHRRAAEAKLADVAAREAKLKTDTEGLRQAIEGLQAEKERWEAIRQKVDADQAAREKALKAGESKLAEDRNQAEALRSTLNQREAALAGEMAAHKRKTAALKAALETP
jgi:chromosome segregation ATPase